MIARLSNSGAPIRFHRVDHRLAGQRRAMLSHHVADHLARHGEHHHVGLLDGRADALYGGAARSLAGTVPGSVDHVVPGGDPLAAERAADVALTDHRNPHAALQPM
jgi:hypothetical protein